MVVGLTVTAAVKRIQSARLQMIRAGDKTPPVGIRIALDVK